MFPDYGVESGYYGQFNRAKHVIQEMPNVSIVDHWQHEDVSLEDFGFTLMVDGNRKVGVTFSENSPQMRMRNKKKIREFIQKETDSKAFSVPRYISATDARSGIRTI